MSTIILNMLRKSLLLMMMATFSMSSPVFCNNAYADEGETPQNEAPTIQNCNKDTDLKDEQITSLVVNCVRSVIITGTKAIVKDLSEYIKDTVVMLFAVVVAVFGIRLVAGEAEVTSKSFAVLAKLAFVSGFAFSADQWSDKLFNMMDALVGMVLPEENWSPWNAIDTFMGNLFGFGNGLTLFNGVTGVVFAAALSASTGSAIFGSAMLAFYNLMMFVLDLIYAYLASYLLMGFSIILAPFMIPLALFPYTERFFRKWLQLVIGAIILPMMLFGFLYYGLNTFGTLIENCVQTMSKGLKDSEGNPSFETFWRMNQPVMSVMSSADPNQVKQITDAVNRRPRITVDDNGNEVKGKAKEVKIYPFTGTEINPLIRTTRDMNRGKRPVVMFDPSTINQIITTFITLWIYCKLLNGLVRKTPELAQRISGSVSISIAFSHSGFKERYRQARHDAGTGLGAILGGYAGGRMSGGAGFPTRSASTLAGILLGGTAGSQILSPAKAANSTGPTKVAAAVNQQVSGLVGRR